jgi:hypothetical protein
MRCVLHRHDLLSCLGRTFVTQEALEPVVAKHIRRRSERPPDNLAEQMTVLLEDMKRDATLEKVFDLSIKWRLTEGGATLKTALRSQPQYA